MARQFSVEDEVFIIENIGKISISEIAEKVGRSDRSIYYKTYEEI